MKNSREKKMLKINKVKLVVINYNKSVMWVYKELEKWSSKYGLGLKLAECKDEKDFITAANSAEIIIVYKFHVTRRILAKLPKLKMIISSGIGYDHIDINAASDYGIIVTNPATHCVEDVAEINLTLTLALSRKLCILAESSRHGKWRPNIQPIHRFNNLKVGILGFGKIGQAFAWRVKTLGFKVIAYSKSMTSTKIKKLGIEPVKFKDLLYHSDIISLHLVLNNQTKHIISENQLRLMKPTAYLINTSRGGLIDEPSLIKALQEKWIAGAGLDVLEKEPPDQDNPLLFMENVIITGHSAANTVEAPKAWISEWKQIIKEYLDGYWPINVINNEVKPKILLKKNVGA